MCIELYAKRCATICSKFLTLAVKKTNNQVNLWYSDTTFGMVKEMKDQMELSFMCQCIERVGTISNISLVRTMPPGGVQKHFRHPWGSLPLPHSTRIIPICRLVQEQPEHCPSQQLSEFGAGSGLWLRSPKVIWWQMSPWSLYTILTQGVLCPSIYIVFQLLVSKKPKPIAFFSRLHQSNSEEDTHMR